MCCQANIIRVDPGYRVDGRVRGVHDGGWSGESVCCR